jgi:hypothetical protein
MTSSEFTSKTADFVTMRGRATKKIDQYDVGGKWKIMHNQQPVTQKLKNSVVVSKKIKVHVQSPDGTLYTINGLRAMDATVADVQKWLSTEIMDLKHPQLTFEGRPLTDNTKTLKECGIKNDATLELDQMMIFVQIDDDEMVDVMVQPSMTLEELKELLQKQHGVSISKKLEYEGTVLRTPLRTLAQYRIPDQADIVVI